MKRSRTSKDIVPLHPELWKALQAHRAAFNDVQKRSVLVFPSESGGLRSGSVLTKPFEDILTVAQIEKRFTPHGCRRTSTDLYRRATTEVVTKAITGHLTTEMHEHYSTVSASEKRAAAKLAFAEIFTSGGPMTEVGDKTKTAGGAFTPSGRDD